VALDLPAIVAAVQTHAAASGHIERVAGHEPTNAPGGGITASVWLDRIRPVPGRSGLGSTSVLVVLQVRLQIPLRGDLDDVDPLLAAAADDLMRAYTGDYTLGGQVVFVDLLGQTDARLEGQAGYLAAGDGQMFRVFTITLPVVIDDLFDQEA
jgi:hypothetical protein